jgi:hypothetical protein
MQNVIVNRGLFVAMLLQAGCCLALSQAVDKNRPYARVCVAVKNSGNGEEEAFQANSIAGAGKSIVVHLDANAKCEVLVTAFNRKDGQLASGWAPQFVQVAEWNEVAVPKAPLSWNWEKDSGAIEFYVLVFAPGSKEGAELQTLASAMQNARSEAVSKLQTNKLHELIGRAKIDKARAEEVVQPETTEIGGVFRNVVGFEWRDLARSVNFTVDKPGALIFPGTVSK